MFEEYVAETWICPICGEVSKVRVNEVIQRNFERNSINVFECSGSIHSSIKVICSECGSECYRK